MKSTVSPRIFEGFLVIGLDVKWMPLFGGKLSFKVFVDKQRRLCIVSEQCLR